MHVAKLLEIFSQDGSWFWGMSQFIVITISLILRQLRIQADAHLVNSLTTLEYRWKSQLILKARRITCGNLEWGFAVLQKCSFKRSMGTSNPCNQEATREESLPGAHVKKLPKILAGRSRRWICRDPIQGLDRLRDLTINLWRKKAAGKQFKRCGIEYLYIYENVVAKIL